jgi:hypothetical protein
MACVACADDGGGSSGGGSGGGTQAEGGPGEDGPDEGGNAPCVVDDDCVFASCCSCAPVTVAQNCDGLGCPSPDCTGLTAACMPDGSCATVLANCDPTVVVCDAAPPTCSGLVPLVVDGCWSGDCVPLENCDPQCAGGRCAWACPEGGDSLSTAELGADGSFVVESSVDGKRYDCVVSFDEEADTFDCSTLAMIGAEMTVTEGTVLALACTEGSGAFAIPIGDPERCALSCMLTAA